MRKKAFIFAIMVAMLFSMLGMNAAFAQDGQTELGFLYIWPECETTMNKSLEAVQQQYPDIKANVSIVPWNEVINHVATSISSGTMYDVFFAWGGMIPGYASTGVVADLTPYFDADPAWKDSFLSDDALGLYSVDGKIMGIPFRGTGTGIIYNATLFNEQGWAVPKTQEELAALMPVIKEAGIQPFAISGKPHGFQVGTIRGNVLNNEMLMTGLISDPLLHNDRLTDWGGLYGKAAETLRDWYHAGYFGENCFAIEREEAQAVFFTGKAAMLMCNNNELPALHTLNDETIKCEFGLLIWPMPEGATGTWEMSGGFNDGFAVYSGTDKLDACAKFLKGLTSIESMTFWANDEVNVMPIKGIQYADPVQEAFAADMGGLTTNRIVADYNTGNKGDVIGDAFVDFMLDDAISGADLEAKVAEITLKVIADAEE